MPTAFTTPIVAPDAFAGYRSADYLSISQYRFAPTSVGTAGLVPGNADPATSSAASLAQVISRVSSMIDDYVFHRSDGSFAASLTVEQMSALVKPDGSLTFLVNYKPLRELVGLSIGPTVSSLSPVDQNTANTIQIRQKSFTLSSFCTGAPVAWFGPWPSINGYVIGLYSYVAGWPHLQLTADATEGTKTLTVAPVVPEDSALYAVFPGTPLTIKDGVSTETVVVSSVSGSTITTVANLLYDHDIPTPPSPDFLPVTALPSAVEQAAIALTNVLVKTQGFRAQELPGSMGTATAVQRKAMGRAGVSGDWDLAHQLLDPFKVSFLHS
jgi:hypothetical protein